MSETTILVIDDDHCVHSAIESLLGGVVDHILSAKRPGEGIRVATQQKPDVILLDINMPEMDGLELCRKLRQTSEVPILFLSSRDDEIDRVLGLELGADDYMGKPFNPRELAARVKAILRRSAGGSRGNRGAVSVGPLTIDWQRREVTLAGESITLRNKEFDLLRALAEHEGIVLSREQLLEQVWGYDYFGETRTVDVHVNQVRRKLGDAAVQIQTVRGVGYKLAAS